MAAELGSQAPDFTLPNQDREPVTLSQQCVNGPVVLAFVPAAFSSVCTKELCDITSGLNTYTGLNADVIGVSVDSPFAQEAWAQKEKIGIKLVSDLNKTTSKAYGDADPAFTYGYGGFQRGDATGGITVTGAASCSRTAGETVGGGPYAITLHPGFPVRSSDISSETAPVTVPRSSRASRTLPARTFSEKSWVEEIQSSGFCTFWAALRICEENSKSLFR